ncbi:hypothetical protein Galf_2415 [Gallionella capsiferriformans ES-2]|uniref:Uncharacterized protein n=2 Tax=Gallionella TaxID=96 RepID=D9SK03_GALCS|nr:hypothetical protein Galf_2415 [Gallionella capsiferriformans ES-2]
MPHFNGFCLSKKYDDSTERSITVALQVTSFEYYYKKCEHSDFPNVNDLLTRALNIEEAKRFFEEMKPQKEALETSSNYFDYCKSKDENNLAVSNKLKWFEYMINKYQKIVKGKDSGDNKPMLQSISNQPARKVVECILAKYKDAEFYADGLLMNDGSIAIQLMAPEMATLAIVRNYQDGSTTQYLNIKNSNNKVIPRSDTFDNAVNICQIVQ